MTEIQIAPGRCCASNTDMTRKCPRYWVCWVEPGCDPSYSWLEDGVALTWLGRMAPADPPQLRWSYHHFDIPLAIFRFAWLDKSMTDTGGFWFGQVRAALASGLKKDKLMDISNPIPLEIEFWYPLVPVFGPEDPDFLPNGINFAYHDTRSSILKDFPNCDLRRLP